MSTCECGCGAEARRRFVKGHNPKRGQSRGLEVQDINEEDRMAYRRVDKTDPEYIERRRTQSRARTRRYRAQKATA